MAQTWDVTLLLVQPAEGYGNTVSAGYGDATVAQSWPVTLLDGSVTGYGNTTSTGFGDATALGESASYTITVTVLETGATRPFYAPLTASQVTAPLDLAQVTAPLDVGNVLAPLTVTDYRAPLDMETEV